MQSTSLDSKFLPFPPFTWLIVGPTNSGKSFLLEKVVGKFIDEGFFLEDNIHLVSPTARYQKYFKDRKIVVHDIKDASAAGSIYNRIKDDADRIEGNYGIDAVPRILIVSDDLFSSTSSRSGGLYAAEVGDMATHGRHLKISHVIIVQQFNGVPRSVRLNSQYITIFEPLSFIEVEDILRQSTYTTDRNAILQAARKVWERVPYGFIHYNVRQHGIQRWNAGFNKPLLSSMGYTDDVDEDTDDDTDLTDTSSREYSP